MMNFFLILLILSTLFIIACEEEQGLTIIKQADQLCSKNGTHCFLARTDGVSNWTVYFDNNESMNWSVVYE
jgi:hypothetical protein